MAKRVYNTYVNGREMQVSTVDGYCYDTYTVALEGNYLSAINTCTRKKVSAPINKSSFLRRSVNNAFASLIVDLGISEGNIPGYCIRDFIENNMDELNRLSMINGIPVEQDPEEAKNEAVGSLIGFGLGLGIVGIAALIEHNSNKKNRR